MSSSAYVATLQGGGFPPFYFVSAVTPWGSIPDTFEQEQETLEDRGVDYTRWRDVRLGYEPFTMQTLADEVSFSEGRYRMINYRRLAKQRFLGTLAYTAGGIGQVYMKVKVLDVVPMSGRQLLSGGSLYGYGASSPSAAILAAQWTLQLTESGK